MIRRREGVDATSVLCLLLSLPLATAGPAASLASSIGTGLGAAAALAKAHTFVRTHAKWKHPSQWAGWTIWGLPDRGPLSGRCPDP